MNWRLDLLNCWMRISILQRAKTFFLSCLIPNYSKFIGVFFTSFFNFFYFSSVKSKHVTYFGKVNRTTFSIKWQNFLEKSQNFMVSGKHKILPNKLPFWQKNNKVNNISDLLLLSKVCYSKRNNLSKSVSF